MTLQLIVKKGVAESTIEQYCKKHKLSIQAIIESSDGKLEVWAADDFPYDTVPFVQKAIHVSDEIDWERQWEAFSPEFSDGKFRLDLTPYGCKKTLMLNPGPGFGDLSHPTTRLALTLLKGLPNGKNVVDIGSGSGILALAAAHLGAKGVVGLDIDKAANLHARKNARLNKLGEVKFGLPRKCQADLFLMNMLFHEQQEAIRSFLPPSKDSIWITSGILKKQKASYEKWLKTLGFRIVKKIEEEGWLGYLLSSCEKSLLIALAFTASA